MRIVLVLRILWTGGAQKIALHEAAELGKLGHDVEVVFLRESGMAGYRDLLSAVNYDVMSKRGYTPLSPVFDLATRLFAPDRGSESRVDFDLLVGLPRYLRSHRPDWIICHDQFTAVGGYYCHKKLGVPYATFLHESMAKYRVPILGSLAMKFEQAALVNSKSIFAVTENVAESFHRRYTRPCIVNLPGMDIQQTAPLSSKERRFIAVAMWDTWRKPFLYLDIIERFPEFSLSMVGNWRRPEYLHAFVAEVQRRSLADRVQMRQGLSEDELRDLFRRSMFSLRFGFNESGLGTSVIESIQNGVPVIMNRDLGTAKLVKDYGCGLVLDFGGLNADKIPTRPIEEFVANSSSPAAYRSIQENIARLGADYTWRHHALKLLEGVGPRV
jgi:glycosyltransferase involved in cell wall biosynthesis